MSMIPCEYIWLDGSQGLRSKTRMLPPLIRGMAAEDLPTWQYDGSSTGQAAMATSDVLLCPVALFQDPFISSGVWILCEGLDKDGEALVSNTRARARKVFELAESGDHPHQLKTQFGFEQEFFIIDSSGKEEADPIEDGQAYCGVGYPNVKHRGYMEAVQARALQMGLAITGKNLEVAPNQYEFQVFHQGLSACDQLIMLRYLMLRQGEISKVRISLHPKPLEGENGSGCHTNVSTKETRGEGGLAKIHQILERGVKPRHEEFMRISGEGNSERMTGTCETSDPKTFTWAESHRGCSVRIPLSVVSAGKGYFEDRRPASNMDPYLVASHLVQCILASDIQTEELSEPTIKTQEDE